MYPSFLPASVYELTETSSINLAQKIQRMAIPIPWQAQGLRTAYVQDGKGDPPMLLLHGFDSSVLEFRRLLPLLAACRETWALDLLGFGFSERLRNFVYHPHNIKLHLYSFWKTLIDRPVVLVGASMGGATALDFALTYPEAVCKVVLINSVGFSGSFAIGPWLSPPVDRLAVEFWRQRKLQSLFWSKIGLSDRLLTDAILCAVLPLEMPLWAEAILSFMKSGGYLQIVNDIPKLKKPTLILWGKRDDMLGTADANRFKNAIFQSQLVWLDAGHVPQWEQPDVVARAIVHFDETASPP